MAPVAPGGPKIRPRVDEATQRGCTEEPRPPLAVKHLALDVDILKSMVIGGRREWRRWSIWGGPGGPKMVKKRCRKKMQKKWENWVPGGLQNRFKIDRFM